MIRQQFYAIASYRYLTKRSRPIRFTKVAHELPLVGTDQVVFEDRWSLNTAQGQVSLYITRHILNPSITKLLKTHTHIEECTGYEICRRPPLIQNWYIISMLHSMLDLYIFAIFFLSSLSLSSISSLLSSALMSSGPLYINHVTVT